MKTPDTQEGSGIKQVLVVYESIAAREFAIRCAPELAIASPETPMAVEWSSFEHLCDAEHAGKIGAKAAAADLVVFALTPSGDLPLDVKLWVENWVNRRGAREGAIIGLIAAEFSPRETACLKEIYLRHTAHRAKMDYLSRFFSSAAAEVIPDSLDSYKQRAVQVTALLDEILHSGAPPHPVLLPKQ